MHHKTKWAYSLKQGSGLVGWQSYSLKDLDAWHNNFFEIYGCVVQSQRQKWCIGEQLTYSAMYLPFLSSADFHSFVLTAICSFKASCQMLMQGGALFSRLVTAYILLYTTCIYGYWQYITTHRIVSCSYIVACTLPSYMGVVLHTMFDSNV